MLKRIFIYTLAALILFSSLGISFYLHTCGCQHTILVSVGVGFNEPEPETCCSSCSSTPAREDQGLSISRKGCCKDCVYFFILPVTQDKVVPQLTQHIVSNVFKVIATAIEQSEISITREIFPSLHSPPLLLSGRKIIYLFQQIKIPNPAC